MLDNLRPAVDDQRDHRHRTNSLTIPSEVIPTLTPLCTDAVNLADYFRILERLAINAHDETWGLSTRPLPPGATGLVLSSLAPCATLFEAAKAIAHTYNILHGGAYNRVALHHDRLAYIIDDRAFPYAAGMSASQTRFTMVIVLIFLHSLLVLVAGDALHEKIRKVHIKGTRLAGNFGGFWGAPIRWKSNTYALDYDARTGSLPISRGGPAPTSQAIYRKIIELIERNPCVSSRRLSTHEQVMAAFEDNVLTQPAVAKRLRLSVATLRRRLQTERSATFRTLSENARERAARSLLDQHYHPNDVAEKLGFSDQRSFARAFKRWTGLTPAAYAISSRPTAPIPPPTHMDTTT
jgi:AraC-like DNA-binding protein